MGNGPTYYRNLTAAPSKEFIATEISTIRSKNQSRRIHDKAVNLTEYRQMLNSTFEKKHYGRIIKLLTGDFPPQLDPHDLPGPNEEHLTDLIECLQAVSAKFNGITAAHLITKDLFTMTTLIGLGSSNHEPPSELISRTS